MKLLKCFAIFALSLALIGIIALFEIKKWPVGSSVAGVFLGLFIPALWHSFQDLSDNAGWKTSQRKLERGKFITDNTIVRISFAYLYRIKIGDKYLLVKNERGTGKYQPVGGVYKLRESEKIKLKNKYQVKDDNKIPIDESSKNDYRLRLENKYLRSFVRHFSWNSERESVTDLSREFKEELIDKGLVSWNNISYRYCGRHMTELKFGEHFQIYELLLADVVELLLNAEQEKELKSLMEKSSDAYRFVTADEILALGVDTATGVLTESIADHTIKIIQEYEGQLQRIRGVGRVYNISV